MKETKAKSLLRQLPKHTLSSSQHEAHWAIKIASMLLENHRLEPKKSNNPHQTRSCHEEWWIYYPKVHVFATSCINLAPPIQKKLLFNTLSPHVSGQQSDHARVWYPLAAPKSAMTMMQHYAAAQEVFGIGPSSIFKSVAKPSSSSIGVGPSPFVQPHPQNPKPSRTSGI